MIDEEIAGWFSQMKAIITTSGRHITINVQQRQQIIAALRRGHEDDKEIGEFQQRVYELCEKFYPYVDGAGSDTGDWRDFTLAEIGQTLNHLAERPPSGEIEELRRQVDLAQTEIKGHMRVQDELKTEVMALNAIIRVRTDALAQAQARIAELEKDAARLDYLEREMELEQQYLRDHPQWIELGRPLSLFRRNVPITRAAIDAALKDRA